MKRGYVFVMFVFLSGSLFAEQEASFIDKEQLLKEDLGVAIRQQDLEKFIDCLVKAKNGGVEDNILRVAIKSAFLELAKKNVGKQGSNEFLLHLSGLGVQDDLIENFKRNLDLDIDLVKEDEVFSLQESNRVVEVDFSLNEVLLGEDLVPLRSGVFYPRKIVAAREQSLLKLRNSSPDTYAYLVGLCKGNKGLLSDDNKTALIKLGFLKWDGSVFEDVREVIRSASPRSDTIFEWQSPTEGS